MKLLFAYDIYHIIINGRKREKGDEENKKDNDLERKKWEKRQEKIERKKEMAVL